MMDINKLIQAEGMPYCEAESYLHDMEIWTEERARTRAQAEGLELDEERMDVLCFLRDLYADCGPAPNARSLMKSLAEAYKDQGGLRYLYRLFPGGPVTQGCRLAGLPVPPGSVDPSFGTAH